MADKNKRKQEEDATVNIKVMLLDIEGTVISISFVRDKLFPYITSHLEEYLNKNWDQEECKQDIAALAKQAEEDKGMDGAVSIPSLSLSEVSDDKKKAAVVKYVNWVMAADRKVTALKQLQGHMWRNAYKKGEVTAMLYEDCIKAFQCWKNLGKKMCIYSSGSVEAQKLLFGHTADGDINHFFSGYYDTKIGSKRDEKSYSKIAEDVGNQPSEIMFLTDVFEEAKAARAAGMKACLVVRPGNAPLSEEVSSSYDIIYSLEELLPEATSKRQKSSSEPVSESEGR